MNMKNVVRKVVPILVLALTTALVLVFSGQPTTELVAGEPTPFNSWVFMPIIAVSARIETQPPAGFEMWIGGTTSIYNSNPELGVLLFQARVPAGTNNDWRFELKGEATPTSGNFGVTPDWCLWPGAPGQTEKCRNWDYHSTVRSRIDDLYIVDNDTVKRCHVISGYSHFPLDDNSKTTIQVSAYHKNKLVGWLQTSLPGPLEGWWSPEVPDLYEPACGVRPDIP